MGCKQVLCFDADRSEHILERLRDNKHGPRIKERFPHLSNLARGNVPAFYTCVGEIRGTEIFAGMSCFHIAHPKMLCQPRDNTVEGDESGQLDAVAASAGTTALSPT